MKKRTKQPKLRAVQVRMTEDMYQSLLTVVTQSEIPDHIRALITAALDQQPDQNQPDQNQPDQNQPGQNQN